MSTDHVPGKPRVGTFVDYFNPRLMQRIGFTEGYGKRYDGPYAALVTNNVGHGLSLYVFFPGITPLEQTDVPHKQHDKTAPMDPNGGTNQPGATGNGYWDWQTPMAGVRAAKELKDAEGL